MFTHLVLGLTVVIAAPAPKEAKKEAFPVVGEWVVEKISAAGMDIPIVGEKTMGFRFQADGALIMVRDGKDDPKQGKYTIDSKQTPIHLDIIPPDGEGKSVKAIIKMDGDKLILCGTNDGAERPTDFVSAAGSKVMIMTLKRAK